MKKESKITGIIAPVISVVCILAVWGISARIVNDKFIIPSLTETVKEFINLLGSGEFYSSLLMTLLKSLISFFFSIVIALFLGIIGYRHPLFKKAVAPIIAVMRALPTVAVVLLLLVWTNSFVAPVIVTALVVLPTVYTSIINGLSEIDKLQIEMCKVFKVQLNKVIFKVELPQIMPSLLNTVGSSLSLNIKLMVAAEVLASTGNCLGNLMQSANVNLETVRLLALVFATVIIGLITEGVFSLLSKKAGEKL